jgi:hypothetical protein
MEHLWSRAVATGGNCWQIVKRPERLKRVSKDRDFLPDCFRAEAFAGKSWAKKRSAHFCLRDAKGAVSSAFRSSGGQDLNLRPPGYEPGLPSLARVKYTRSFLDGASRTRTGDLLGAIPTTVLGPPRAGGSSPIHVGWDLQALCKHQASGPCRAVPLYGAPSAMNALNHALQRNTTASGNRSGRLCKPDVTGSIPVRSTSFIGRACDARLSGVHGVAAAAE